MSRKKKEISTALATVIAAACGLLGAALGAYFQANSGVWSEEERRQSQLILKAVDEEDDAKAAANLLFFVEAGLIDDPDGKISGLARSNLRISMVPNDLLAVQRALHGESCGIRIEAKRQIYYAGDLIEATLRSDRACYFRVFWVDRTGQTLVTTPLPWGPAGRDFIEAGGIYSISPSELSSVIATRPLGMDLLIVIAKPRPFTRIGADSERSTNGFSIGDLVAAHVLPEEIDDVSVAIKLLFTVSRSD